MIDLSHPIAHRMPVYPGDPQVTITDALQFARDGVQVTEIVMGSHTGTHLDAPSHTVPNGRRLEEITLDELVGDALILRVPGARADQALTPADLGLDGLREVPHTVAIDTGWPRYFGTPEYFSHPYLTREAAERLCDLGMHVLAVDTPSPDQSTVSGSLVVHEVVLGSDRLIVENLCGLDRVPDRVRIGFFPLPLTSGDGAPVRAVTLEHSC